MLEWINKELIAGKRVFKTISPGMWDLVGMGHLRAVKVARNAERVKDIVVARRRGESYAQITGNWGSGKVIGHATKPVRKQVRNAHLHMPTIQRDMRRKNGMGGRSWITKPGPQEMVIIFHDANRAGPHIDVHIGRVSLIYRVKPEIYSQLKYNSEGYLTGDSKDLLVNHVKSEIANGSRVPQNIDHSKSNARASWVGGSREDVGYGSGITRQVVSVSEVEILKAHKDGPIEFYSPVINSTKILYLYKIYPGTDKRAPMCIWGEKQHKPPIFKDRLHLKLTHPEDLDTLDVKADMSTSTAKYDGSSCYFVIGPKGTTVWSPRTSKVTGRQIEYTHKIRGVHNITSPTPIVGMGEVVFVKKNRNPFRRETYIAQSEISGILNSNSVPDESYRPEIRIYRIDKLGREDLSDQDFWENRQIQQRTANLEPNILHVVELMDPQSAKDAGFEGVVVVPQGGSVNDGYKVKWWTDPHDWVIDEVCFTPGERGGVAGVIKTTSLDSGKTFNLGPGQVGNRELTEHMMAHPEQYEGTVLKVHSRHGHEGRAAKVISFHDDKGVG